MNSVKVALIIVFVFGFLTFCTIMGRKDYQRWEREQSKNENTHDLSDNNGGVGYGINLNGGGFGVGVQVAPGIVIGGNTNLLR